jgi:hypothetical protein
MKMEAFLFFMEGLVAIRWLMEMCQYPLYVLGLKTSVLPTSIRHSQVSTSFVPSDDKRPVV